MTSRPDQPIAVLGAGAWGTALAIQMARSGRSVRLWGRDPAHLAEMVEARENRRRLPGAAFPASLQAEPDLDRALDGVRDVLVAVPSHAFREMLGQLAQRAIPGLRLAWATKGFEPGTGRLAEAVVAEVLGDALPMAVLTGPTFAAEVGRGQPTAMTVAASDTALADDLAATLHGEQFRAYTSDDVIGAEVGGAVKNVIAIGAGVSDGLGFGANARVALITRGLAEMMRLGEALGGRAQTLTGLAGMGDLVLTCTDDQSRNRRFGLALAAGRSVEQAKSEIGLVEGALAAAEVRRLGEQLGIDLPIAAQVHAMVYDGVSPRLAAESLLNRSRTEEEG
ncbi:glycerol-3-phosphate dehydrogenase (NAD(P)+) [Natronospira proteinivora]|uniref:Glycerol-3-phosphate dehydrogenase [NAD(P)+] n=1 Tax=Natronospira proteinivora TaxID=1807133 RepID=A0ABT1G9W1_9GAMM|nr:NAD(P)H-dependent glycerol-3-phosphate dehydrogenase [Natronospira proteinivora]MCP1728102.1 glycerol-3-phosphate dehydrogenase (NAD(P)+) [Natronospira proteinivora]